jgi:hypothetical protein
MKPATEIKIWAVLMTILVLLTVFGEPVKAQNAMDFKFNSALVKNYDNDSLLESWNIPGTIKFYVDSVGNLGWMDVTMHVKEKSGKVRDDIYTRLFSIKILNSIGDTDFIDAYFTYEVNDTTRRAQRVLVKHVIGTSLSYSTGEPGKNGQTLTHMYTWIDK